MTKYEVKKYLQSEQHPYTIIVEPYNDDLTIIQYPPEFVESNRVKAVIVLAVNCLIPVDTDPYGNEYNTSQYLTPQHIAVHASFNQEYDNSNQFICMANEQLIQPKVFRQYTTQLAFKLWFQDLMTDEIIGIPDNVKVVIELLLEF